MTPFKIDERTLCLLSAQVNLNATFTHTLRTIQPRQRLAFRLQVDRCKDKTHFTVELCSERHSLILPNTKNMHFKLAEFIEEIANGPNDPVHQRASAASSAHAA
jgi:hypothetical protein